MSIKLDKQPLFINVAEAKWGDTIAFDEKPVRVFLVTHIMLDESEPDGGHYLSTKLIQHEDGSAHCRLIVDLETGLARTAHLSEVCRKVDIASEIT